jgi:hypothetical protein
MRQSLVAAMVLLFVGCTFGVPEGVKCEPDGGCGSGGLVCNGLTCEWPDASVDAGAVDAGAVDAGAVDAGAVDAGAGDAGTVDAGTVDAGTDAGVADSGVLDASVPVTAFDGGWALALPEGVTSFTTAALDGGVGLLVVSTSGQLSLVRGRAGAYSAVPVALTSSGGYLKKVVAGPGHAFTGLDATGKVFQLSGPLPGTLVATEVSGSGTGNLDITTTVAGLWVSNAQGVKLFASASSGSAVSFSAASSLLQRAELPGVGQVVVASGAAGIQVLFPDGSLSAALSPAPDSAFVAAIEGSGLSLMGWNPLLANYPLPTASSEGFSEALTFSNPATGGPGPGPAVIASSFDAGSSDCTLVLVSGGQLEVDRVVTNVALCGQFPRTPVLSLNTAGGAVVGSSPAFGRAVVATDAPAQALVIIP